MKRLKWLIWALGVIALGAAVQILRKRRSSEPAPPAERRSDPDPEALQVMMNGGATHKIGLDLEQLQGLNPDAYQPLVEYLTYIQVQRGDRTSSLVFVRDRDIESLATMLHQTKEEFMENFQKLGVMLSMN